MAYKVAHMQEKTVGGLVSISHSSSFREMDEAEMRNAFGGAFQQRFAMRDDAHHIIFSVVWDESKRFLGGLASARDGNHGIEKRMRKTMRNSGYVFEGHFDREVAGQIATGFSYRYEVAGTVQAGDVVTIKCGRTLLSFYGYYDAKTEKLSRKVFDDIIASVRIL